MKLGYTIWNKKHFTNIESLVDTTKDVVDYYIITTWPVLQQDNLPVFMGNGIDKSYQGDWVNENIIRHAIEVCKQTNKKLCLQLIPTQLFSRGKEPRWWEGYINFDTPSQWRTFFNDFKTSIQDNLELFPDADKYLLGAELSSTLSQTARWQDLFHFTKQLTDKELGYSHHFSRALKYHYRFPLLLGVMFGYFFRRDKIYADILKRLLSKQFKVPDKYLVSVGKSLYHSPNINNVDMDFVKLNDYWWYVLDKEYTEIELRTRWETVTIDGITVNFMSAVKSWIKKYVKDTELWIENDLTIGYTNCSDEYYKMWWRVFLTKHKDLADVIVVWDNGDYKRWTDAINDY